MIASRTDQDEPSIPREEWLRRYKVRLMTVAALTEAQAEDVANTLPFEELSEDFEFHPEDAADSEMSYWDDDGDVE